MEANPHVVFFYMIGCPHCEHARPMWEAVKREVPSDIKVLEFESANLPEEARSRVQGFPRFERTDGTGVIIAMVEGAPKSAEELKTKLKLKKEKGSGRRTRKGGRRARRARHTRRRQF
jgi:thiol-disulfide isomerase/thioredoxin